jgi:hypothetical protein
MASIARKKDIERYAEANRRCARIIIERQADYPGLVEWARGWCSPKPRLTGRNGGCPHDGPKPSYTH